MDQATEAKTEDVRTVSMPVSEPPAAPANPENGAAPAPTPLPTVVINGKTINYGKVMPLSLGDWKRLRKNGVDLFRLRGDNVDVEHISQLVYLILQKADPSITEEQIDELPGRVVMDIATIAMTQGDVNVPT